MKQAFLVIYRPGPAWTEGKPVAEQPPREHGKYLLGLYRDGVLRSAGPFGDDSGAALVIEAEGAEAARQLILQDPAVASKIFTYEIHPWHPVPWEKYLNAGQQ